MCILHRPEGTSRFFIRVSTVISHHWVARLWESAQRFTVTISSNGSRLTTGGAGLPLGSLNLGDVDGSNRSIRLVGAPASLRPPGLVVGFAPFSEGGGT